MLPRKKKENGNIKWVDVLAKLKNVQKTLRAGQMIHDSSFNHERVMSATELGDPKMDPTLPSEIVYIEDLLKNNEVAKEASSQECVGLLDELFLRLICFLNGTSFEDSICTCLYFYAPDFWPSKYLKSFYFLLIKSCLAVRDCNRASQVCEEDEFAFKQGFTILERRVPTFKADLEMPSSEIIAEVRQHVKILSGSECPWEKQASLRLELIYHFYLTEINFQTKNLKLLRQGCSKALLLIEQILNSKESPSCEQFFFPGISRDFDCLRSPRNRKMPGRTESWNLWKSHFQDALKLTEMNFVKQWEQALIFGNNFGNLQASVTNRSHYVLLVGINFGEENFYLTNKSITQILKENFKKFCPWARCLTANMEVIFEMYIARIVPMHLEINRWSGRSIANKLRYFEYLSEDLNKLLDYSREFETKNFQAYQKLNNQYLQQHEDETFEPLRNSFTWPIVALNASLMMNYIEMTFVLKLFNPSEFHYAYVYYGFLIQCKYKCIASAASRPYANIQQLKKHLKGAGGKKKGKKKKKSQKKKLKNIKIEKTQNTAENPRNVLIWAVKFICKGICLFIQSLKALNIEWEGTREFNFGRQELNFTMRFKAFFQIYQPRPLSYEEFKVQTEAKKDVEELLGQAGDYFEKGKEYFKLLVGDFGGAFHSQELLNFKQCLKVCVANAVATKQVKLFWEKKREISVKHEFKHHPYFINFSVSQRQLQETKI